MRRRDLLTAALCTAALSGCSVVDRLRGTPQRAVPEAPGDTTRAAPPTPGTPAEIAARSTVPVLCYHQVREYTAADGAGARPLICPPAVLRRQLEGLLAAGMQPVTGEALVDHLQLGTPLADNAVLVSFDDASGGQYTNALPILQRLGIPATFFVMTVVLDRPNWLSRDDVRALDAAGMTIASHTWDHHPVTRYGEKDWATQLAKPREQLGQIVGHDVELFAYPYGAVEPGGVAARAGGGLPRGVPADRAAAGRPAAPADRSTRAHPAHVGRPDAARAHLTRSPRRVTAAGRDSVTAGRAVTHSGQPLAVITCW